MTSPSRHFGFWVSGNSVEFPHYVGTNFAIAMFLTPPYPSSMEFMAFGAMKDIQAGTTNPASGEFTANDIKFLKQVTSVTDQYPNIQINVMVALGSLENPLALTYFQYYVSQLASHPSIYSLGLEGEYSSSVTAALEAPLQQAALSAGKQYIDYYKNAVGYQILHTNWPMDNNWYLPSASNSVGFSAGYDSGFPFPGTCQLSPDPSQVNNNACGWTQAEEQFLIQYGASTNDQFVHFTAGADSSGSFAGVSGQTTNQMWDNPTLRNWIWTDPNYQGNFVLSTSSVTSSTSTTSSTTSSNSSSLTTTNSTSIQTSTSATATSTSGTSYSTTGQSSSNTSASAGESTGSQKPLSDAYLLLPVAIVLVGTGVIFLKPGFRRERIRR